MEETPASIFFNGELVPWEKATVHVWSETAIRATNVFEGLKAYWDEGEQRWYLLQWERHMKRLMQSAALLRLPHPYSAEDFERGVRALLPALAYRQDMYVRPTIYIERGRYGFRAADVVTGMYVVAFPQPAAGPEIPAIRCCVSSWRRSGDLAGSPRIKSGANYQNLRLPRVDAAMAGFDDAILLNDRSTVAELTGAALFIVRGREVVTPPFSAGILESITRGLVIELLREERELSFTEREIDRTELYVADEVLGAGTLSELVSVVEIDHHPIGGGTPGPVTSRLASRYRALARGGRGSKPGWFLPVDARSA